MRWFSPWIWVSAIFSVLSAGIASAQNINFLLTFTAPGQQPITFTNDTTVPLSSNTPAATITAEYIGSTSATITTGPGGPPPWLVGSTEFTVTTPKTEMFPLTLSPGQSLTFTITFKPLSSMPAAGTITIPFTEVSTGTTGPTTSAIVIPLLGSVPSITFAYALSNGNAVQIAPGQTIPFGATPLNTPATAKLAVFNSGSGTAEVTGITYPPSTSPFQVSNAPLATPTNPYPLTAGSTTPLSLTITYTPTAVETDTGQITFMFLDGTIDTINLSGSGVTSTLSYCTVSGTTCATLPVGGTITFPPVAVATSTSTQTSSSVIVKVQNTGAATATINSISTAAPFSVTGTQQTFPITLAQGAAVSFTVSYTPTQVGSCPANLTQCGTLVIGNAVFMLSGTGLGPQLTFSYASAGTTVSLGTGGEVVFPNTQVSQSTEVPFTITNSGTTATTVVLVSASPSPPFSVPTLGPVTLAAGKSTTFPITFAPTTMGSAAGTLSVNNVTVALIGAGTAPPALPSYTITGPSGTAQPATQAPISLTLAKSYPVNLEGVLTLTTSGTLPSDMSVQFSTGSSVGNRTVDFVIPAGSTSANFASQGSQIFVQTGTVNETVTVTPSFMTAGGVDVTPTNPQALQFTIAPAAPVLENLQITDAVGSPTSASFDLVLQGYSTTRELSTVNVTFTPASGFNLSTSQPPIDVSGPSSVWFQSSSSIQSFGGLFQVTISFNLSGKVASNQSLLEAIASVTATISNGVGTSSSAQVGLQ
jgi:hypothetical protein